MARKSTIITPADQPTTTDTTADQPEPRESIIQAIARQARPAIVITLVLTVIVGIIYPLAVYGVGQAVFPHQANGSLVTVNGKTVASSLIGQYWTQPGYFHGRPSATNNTSGTPTPYQADTSGASNLGPTNAGLISTVQARIDALQAENPDVAVGTQIPVDLVTASGSGLDPDISVAGAYYQVARIAKARGLSQAAISKTILDHVQGRFLGIFGEPHLNVLELNMALDALQGK